MKTHSRQNPLARAWRTARDEGWWSLIDSMIPDWLPRVHAHLPSGFSSMEDILRWLERHNKYEVYSFDVFDTLLRRRIDPPELIKALAAEYLSARLVQHGINISQVEILAQRKRCEEILLQEALSKGRDADYRLDDVMTETLKALSADSVVDSREAVSYEIELEKKAAQPMPGAVAALSYLKSAGKRVICMSDSYLSANQMAAIFEHQNLMKYIDKLYVSSEIGKRKSTGRLFQHVLETEGSKLVHIGDNYTSDYIIPKRLGIKALRLNTTSEQARKRKLRKLRAGKNKMDYVNAIVRSDAREGSELHRIGYAILGPALTVFVHNVAERARKDDIEALFFIARDGYALKKIYEILQNNIYANASLPPGKYMCLSRFPVRLASAQKFAYSELRRAAEKYGGKRVSLKDILNSYGFQSEQFASIAQRYRIDVTEPIDYKAHDGKLRAFLEDSVFQETIEAGASSARRLLREYLASIGFFGRHNVGFVDANVEGLTQSLLAQAFAKDKDYPTVHGYYLNVQGLDKRRRSSNIDLSQVKGLVSDWRRDSYDKQEPFLRLGILVELFSHPNHGVTVGYKNVDGKIVPVFRKTPQETQYSLTSQGLQGMLAYARDYSSYYSLHNYKCDELLENMKSNVRSWAPFPPKRDAEALKSLFMTSDWPQEVNTPLVKQITVKDIVTVRGLVQKARESLWPEATLALAPAPRASRLIFKAATCSIKVIERCHIRASMNCS